MNENQKALSDFYVYLSNGWTGRDKKEREFAEKWIQENRGTLEEDAGKGILNAKHFLEDIIKEESQNKAV